MTDDRLNIMARALALGFIVFIMLLVFIAQTLGQDTHTHNGTDLARFRLIRIIPAKVTYVERNEKGTRVEYVAKDKYEIENGFFEATKETLGDEAKKGEFFWFSYCVEDRFLYAMYRPTAEQLRALK